MWQRWWSNKYHPWATEIFGMKIMNTANVLSRCPSDLKLRGNRTILDGFSNWLTNWKIKKLLSQCKHVLGYRSSIWASMCCCPLGNDKKAIECTDFAMTMIYSTSVHGYSGWHCNKYVYQHLWWNVTIETVRRRLWCHKTTGSVHLRVI